MRPKAIAFDMDQTLTMSKEPLSTEMAKVLLKLSEYLPTAVVSGATCERLQTQLKPVFDIKPVPIYLFPTSGAAMYKFVDNAWKEFYKKEIIPDEVEKINSIVTKIVEDSKLLEGYKIFGPQIEFRGSQITLSTLGQEAPYEEKAKWDPDKQKRNGLREKIAPLLPDYEVTLGSTTSIDIVQKGVNKALAVKKFAEHLNIDESEILYVGDDLEEGGNDYVVATESQAMTHLVDSPEDTLHLIIKILNEVENA